MKLEFIRLYVRKGCLVTNWEAIWIKEKGSVSAYIG